MNFKKHIKRIINKKEKAAKETLKHILTNIRTDSYQYIPCKDLRGTADNYRIEAIDLLDAVSFLFRIAEELDCMAKEREKKIETSNKKITGTLEKGEKARNSKSV